MSSTSLARALLWPDRTDIVARVALLYVGQGSSTIVFARGNGTYKTMLVDINLDRKAQGINVPAVMLDLVGDDGLDYFVNTHPHDDHLCGLDDLDRAVLIKNVWHSGHIPSRKHGACYGQLKAVCDKVQTRGGGVRVLEGSREEQRLGDARYYVLSPASYVTDEVNDEEADARYRRIHEQCAVVKFGLAPTWVMIPGDADRAAFENHITEYHKERLSAVVLAASHHASRTFFRDDETQDPYTAALEAINPSYVTVSAPERSESRHEHPHEDALDLYRKQCGNDNVLHAGPTRSCYVCDVYADGSYSGVNDDRGRLARAYPLPTDGASSNGDKGTRSPVIVTPRPRTRIDDRPMG
jgi:beta-lactamase superfamily II metal-dependent hydrolase